jgi:hypothetical protein
MIECPNHQGNFDCTPFCKVCEGNQEYQEDRYFRIQFSALPYDLYQYGATALEAIKNARQELDGLFATLGNATARPAVYKEWSYGTYRYTNGGDFLK